MFSINVSIPRYSVNRQDRSQSGTGFFIYIKNSLNAKVAPDCATRTLHAAR